MREIGGEVEAAVMDIVWSAPESMTVSEVCQRINTHRSDRPLARTTVLTVLTNLATKGLLHRHDGGRAYRYSPAIAREQYTAQMMAQALDRTTDRTAALLYFADHLDPGERDAFLRQARRRRR